MIVKRKLNYIDFAILTLASFIFFAFQKISLKETKTKYFKLKKKAAINTFEAFKAVKEEVLRRGIEIDTINDPLESGLIGLRESEITTDLGDLDAKLTSINPNFSALFVEWLKKIGVKKGDYVAVAYTGSFPALNIAMTIAIQTIGAKPIIITSLGSSNWGANHPEWTYLDIENFLYKKGFFKFKTVAASRGGADDIGRGLSETGRNLLDMAIKRNNIKIFIQEKPLQKAVERRMEIYDSIAGNGRIKAFINIGGGVAVFGVSDLKEILKEGIILPYRYSLKDFSLLPVKGVVLKFMERGIPIINVIDIKRIARKYNMPIAPAVMPSPVEGKIFFKKKYSLPFILLEFVFFIVIIGIILYIKREEQV